MSGVRTSVKTLQAENKRLRKKVADLQQEKDVMRQQIVTLTKALSVSEKKVAQLSPDYSRVFLTRASPATRGQRSEIRGQTKAANGAKLPLRL